MIKGFKKNWLPFMLVALLSLGFATAASAAPKGMGQCGMGPGMGKGQCGMGAGMGKGQCGMGAGMGCGMGHGMNFMQLPPEQAAKAFDLRQKFMNDTAEMRKQMWVKRAELRELWQAKEPEQAKITAKQKEISAVRDQLQEKATAFKLDMRKEFPNIASSAGCPMMGGGKGPGGCPMTPPAPGGAKQ